MDNLVATYEDEWAVVVKGARDPLNACVTF